jgi:hypothetical protein
MLAKDNLSKGNRYTIWLYWMELDL